MSKLKPCPFCGSSDVEIMVDGMYYWVECNHCQASTKTRMFFNDTGNVKDIVAEDWNKRVHDPVKIEGLEAIIRDLKMWLSKWQNVAKILAHELAEVNPNEFSSALVSYHNLLDTEDKEAKKDY